MKNGLPQSRAVAARYEALVVEGEIEADAAQIDIVRLLDKLNDDLAARQLESQKSSLGWLFGRRKQSRAVIQGLYIWGDVGRGKTMLMDLFFDHCPFRDKRRAHFHEFMADIHERIHQHRQALKRGEVSGDDPIPPVAAALAEEARLLCFDEFSVRDIADAMILGRLFTQFFELGVTVVATSNVEPRNLYQDGLNRSLFLPFIDLLEQYVNVVCLDARTDFRLEKLSDNAVFLMPLTLETVKQMNILWHKLTGSPSGQPEKIEYKGRQIEVPLAAAGAARFKFADLCAKPLGAADYLKLTEAYHTIFIDGIPAMAQAQRNEAKRFINLIDTLYDQRTRLVVSAEVSPQSLYQATSGAEVFEFDRTISRLIEMQSSDYLEQTVAQAAVS
ncbi:MAG: cell division protein ZapE [Stappiaceae bacterium]